MIDVIKGRRYGIDALILMLSAVLRKRISNRSSEEGIINFNAGIINLFYFQILSQSLFYFTFNIIIFSPLFHEIYFP